MKTVQTQPVQITNFRMKMRIVWDREFRLIRAWLNSDDYHINANANLCKRKTFCSNISMAEVHDLAHLTDGWMAIHILNAN